MREIAVAGRAIDAGPTVLTMRWVFEELFAAHGEDFSDHVTLRPAEILARHAWSEHERLDLFADNERSADAIGDLAGSAEARRFLAFCERARATYATLEGPFIKSAGPTPISLTRGAGLKGLGDLWRISPFTTLWHALGTYFHDQRLRQLFGRYATYCGSSPFAAPATLMLVAHVEQAGVWLVEGGMHRLAVALADGASAHGARFRYGAEVREVEAKSGIVSGVTLATASGSTLRRRHRQWRCRRNRRWLLRRMRSVLRSRRSSLPARSLSAVTFSTSRRDARLSADAAQRVLLARLSARVRRHLRARQTSRRADRLCLRAGSLRRFE